MQLAAGEHSSESIREGRKAKPPGRLGSALKSFSEEVAEDSVKKEAKSAASTQAPPAGKSAAPCARGDARENTQCDARPSEALL